MVNKKIFLILFIISFTLSFTLNTFCFAYTEKISVDGMNHLIDIFDYLNSNNYHFSASIREGDVYLSKDNSVIVTTGKGINSLLYIDVLAPEHPTNRGIEVGMNVNDIINAYGPIYPENGFWQEHRNEKDCGMYYPVKNEYYSGYYIIDYQSVVSSLLQGESADGIEFLINRKTQEIVLIHYYSSMHRQVDLSVWIQKYELVPPLK